MPSCEGTLHRRYLRVDSARLHEQRCPILNRVSVADTIWLPAIALPLFQVAIDSPKSFQTSVAVHSARLRG